jgi:ubiquinone/menaquinone biosynthesis C-methylase UbiE
MTGADNSIDCMVAMSVFEFIDDLDSACEEMIRVLRPNGQAFITATGDSPALDLGLKLMTGESADDDFADRRARVETAIREHFVIDRVVGFPRFSVLGIQVYRAFGLRARP